MSYISFINITKNNYSLKPSQWWKLTFTVWDELQCRRVVLLFSFNTWRSWGSKSKKKKKKKMSKSMQVISKRTKTQIQFFLPPKPRFLPNMPWLQWWHISFLLLLSHQKSTQLPIRTRLCNGSNSSHKEVFWLMDYVMINCPGGWFGDFVRACFTPQY